MWDGKGGSFLQAHPEKPARATRHKGTFMDILPITSNHCSSRRFPSHMVFPDMWRHFPETHLENVPQPVKQPTVFESTGKDVQVAIHQVFLTLDVAPAPSVEDLRQSSKLVKIYLDA